MGSPRHTPDPAAAAAAAAVAAAAEAGHSGGGSLRRRSSPPWGRWGSAPRRAPRRAHIHPLVAHLVEVGGDELEHDVEPEDGVDEVVDDLEPDVDVLEHRDLVRKGRKETVGR